MDTHVLTQILREETEKFAGEGLNSTSYMTVNETIPAFAVIDDAVVKGRRYVDAVLVARIVDNTIIIDLDLNTPTLAEALLARGVPASQIVEAYLAPNQSQVSSA